MDFQEAHHKFLLHHLDNYQQAGIFTDITLIINSEKIKAHRLILACHSPYFLAMFQSNMSEASSSELPISGVEMPGFQLLLEYMYTGKLALTKENVFEVIFTADYLQMDPEMILKSIEFLLSIADEDNVVDIMQLVELYRSRELQVLMVELLLKAFTTRHDVVRMLVAKHIEFIVDSDLPIVGNEIDLLAATLRWFLVGNSEEELKQKETKAHKILPHIRFDEISRDSFQAIILEFFPTARVRSAALKEILYELYSSSHRNSLHIIKDIRSPRGMQPAILSVDAFVTNDIFCSSVHERNWRLLTTIPGVRQSNYGTAVLNNQLYIVTGRFNPRPTDESCSYSFLYEPGTNSWKRIASPTAADRCHFTVTALNNKLYSVGGSDANGLETNIAECYDPALNKWTFIKSLPDYRQEHAAVAMERDNLHLLFVSGGLRQGTVMASMYMYDEKTDTWTSCAPMLTTRAKHYMFAYKDEVYVCGGCFTDPAGVPVGMLDMNIGVSTIEAYNITENMWRHVATRPVTPTFEKVALYGSRLFFIGSTMCFDLETKQWMADVNGTDRFMQHSVVVMNVPKLVKDSDISSII